MNETPGPSSPPASRVSNRRTFIIGIVLCLIVAALLRPFPAQFKFRSGGDCVRYLTWSQAVRAEGFAAFPKLVVEYRQKWVGFPPPTRWLYLSLIALLMALWPNAGDVYHPLVLISWLCGVLSLIPLGVWLRRRAPPEVVLLALGLTATAPVLRALSHFPLPDSLQLLATLTLFALISEWLYAPSTKKLLGIGATAFVLVTTRETGFLALFGGAALVLVDRREVGRLRRAPLFAMLGGCVAALVLTIPIAGGPTALFLLAYDVVHGALFTTGSAPYVSGPYYRYLVDFMIVSPALLVTALVGIAPLYRGEFGRAVAPIALASLVTLIGFSILPKTLRYVMPVDAGLRAIAAFAVYALWRSRGPKWGLALLITLVGHDLAIWHRLWGKDQIYDPVTWGLARYLHMIP